MSRHRKFHFEARHNTPHCDSVWRKKVFGAVPSGATVPASVRYKSSRLEGGEEGEEEAQEGEEGRRRDDEYREDYYVGEGAELT